MARIVTNSNTLSSRPATAAEAATTARGTAQTQNRRNAYRSLMHRVVGSGSCPISTPAEFKKAVVRAYQLDSGTLTPRSGEPYTPAQWVQYAVKVAEATTARDYACREVDPSARG